MVCGGILMGMNQVSGPVSFLPHILSWRTFATHRREVSCEQLKWSFERPLNVRAVKLLFSVELVQGLSKWNVHIGKNRECRQTWLTVHSTYRTKSTAQLHGSAGKRHESLAEDLESHHTSWPTAAAERAKHCTHFLLFIRSEAIFK